MSELEQAHEDLRARRRQVIALVRLWNAAPVAVQQGVVRGFAPLLAHARGRQWEAERQAERLAERGSLVP